MKKSTFSVSVLNGDNEAMLIWLTLNNVRGIYRLKFDYRYRLVTIYHDGDPDEIVQRLSFPSEPCFLVRSKTIKNPLVKLLVSWKDSEF